MLRTIITYDLKKNKPIIRIIAYGDKDTMALELLSAYNNISVQLEYEPREETSSKDNR